MRKRNMKILAIAVPFLLMTILGSMNTINESKAIAGSWVTINMDTNLMWGKYTYVSGHYKAQEQYWNDGWGTYGQSFWCGFTAQSAVPSNYVTNARIKIYIKDANTLPWIWGDNERICVTVSCGSTYFHFEIDADNYPSGGYYTYYLGVAPLGKTIRVTYNDYTIYNGINGDGASDVWYIDPPIIEYYSTITPF
jgi:hypothetical protein